MGAKMLAFPRDFAARVWTKGDRLAATTYQHYISCIETAAFNRRKDYNERALKSFLKYQTCMYTTGKKKILLATLYHTNTFSCQLQTQRVLDKIMFVQCNTILYILTFDVIFQKRVRGFQFQTRETFETTRPQAEVLLFLSLVKPEARVFELLLQQRKLV